jgi:2-desacetyl-2-hydroxyethyl bacteriochlorophyllide A dehydrogenase
LTKGENTRYYALIIGSSIFTIRLKGRCFYAKESMRQIVLQAPGEFIERQVPEPSPEPGHALLRMKRVGVCGSDFHAYRGTHPAYTYPRILGHELAGEVLQAPADQNSIKQGDRCAIEPYWACGHCPPCLKGRTNCCDNIRVFGIHIDGGLQGVLSVPVHLLHKSASLNFEQLALVETLGIGAHAVHRSGLEKGESALVIGAGPIGLAVMQFAQAAGADVVVVEKNKRRREFAASFGVEAIAGAEDRTANVVFDATGSAAAMSASLEHVSSTGRLVFAGLTKERVCLDDPLLHKREITVFASRNSKAQFPRIIKMIEKCEIDISRWINERMSLAEVPERFKGLIGNSSLIKAMIEVEAVDV